MTPEREMIHRALTAYGQELRRLARGHKYAGPSFTEVRAQLRARAHEFERLAVRYANPLRECAHCGQMCGDYNGGCGGVDDPDGNPVSVCHPNEPGRPDCYRLVTVYHQPLGSLKRKDRWR